MTRAVYDVTLADGSTVEIEVGETRRVRRGYGMVQQVWCPDLEDTPIGWLRPARSGWSVTARTASRPTPVGLGNAPSIPAAGRLLIERLTAP